MERPLSYQQQDQPSRSSANPGPPQEAGIRLATFPRSGREGESELRVSLDDYEGHEFVSVRVWTKSAWGTPGWWPSKKGVSVRLGEAEGVARALLAALDLAGGQAPPTPPTPARGGRRRVDPADLPGPGRPGEAFDEFA